jgi:hypothetical protein
MEFQFLRPVRYGLLALLLGVTLSACEKEIEVELPETGTRIVVEGNIETGQPPFVLLTRTQSFFAPTSAASLSKIFITDAVVTVDDGFQTYTLQKLCSSLLPDSLLNEVAVVTGFPPQLLAQAELCIWTDLGGQLLGQEGRSYKLSVVTEGQVLTSTTTIPRAVALDSLWFRLAEQRPGDDSLGYIWVRFTDPDTLGNAYRWFAQRLNMRPNGRPKDLRFIAPLLTAFEDRYINGLTLDLNFYRGRAPYTPPDEDPVLEVGFFKRNDTVAVKFASIGQAEYRFIDSSANNVLTEGDIFSNPANIQTNITGGLGAWIGYGAYIDTVICIP